MNVAKGNHVLRPSMKQDDDYDNQYKISFFGNNNIKGETDDSVAIGVQILNVFF